ncbi:hypothetical protein [Janthinobacterium sp. PAMC25594]|uniref:hypothetical protein n=1 Tax=Janthinobacterium sp. PAMC25594 TaxID=2861284 RepID=UPI001C636814|nr:hypothetical protein [Janthinobacterium sp. PAMC25594]QYG08078.1 hypothetical protein KY494_04570 [Janthinobacterium sp. PAMC25594]
METFKRFKIQWVAPVACGALAVGALIQLGLHQKFSPSDWAAWVQAIGSVTAILGAYHLGHIQVERAKQDRLKAFFAICTAAFERSELACAIFGVNGDLSRQYADYDDSRLESIINALNAIPIHEVGNAEAVAAILDLRDQMFFLLGAVKDYRAEIPYFGETDQGAMGLILVRTKQVRSENVSMSAGNVQRFYKIIKFQIGQ